MRSIVVCLIVASSTFATRAHAQDCECDHMITPGAVVFDAAAQGVDPGDVVCVMAGDYEFIRFQNLAGSASSPIVITNCGGVVEVRNTHRAYAIVFENDSHHFHFTGTGAEGIEYGFRASAPDKDPWPGVPLWMQGRSTQYEIDHVEVYDSGFAGVMAKTDPFCDGTADQGNFTQRDVHLHHLWVHDTGGEGFYVGSTQSSGHTIECGGMDEVHQPHFLEGIEIDHVLVERTQWDGMQVGMAHERCSVHDNVIRHVGLAGVQYQQQGLQIGTYSGCDIRRNTFEDGPTNGVFVLNAYSTTVADNVIIDFDDNGVYANIGSADMPASYRIVHNTIVGAGERAIQVFGPTLVDSVAWNNLVVGDADDIAAGGDVDWEATGNIIVGSREEAGFYGRDDYHLLETSIARGAGLEHGSEFSLDRNGLLRASPPSVGAYEYDPDAPLPPGDGGCGCRAFTTRSPSKMGGVLIFLILLGRLGTRISFRSRSGYGAPHGKHHVQGQPRQDER